MMKRIPSTDDTDLFTSTWTLQERVMGIEPTCPAWKAGALPLSYTRRRRFQSPFASRFQ